MRIWPIFLDSQPPYLGGARDRSLLAVPLGTECLVDHLRRCVGAVTPNQPTIVAPEGAGPDFVEAMAEVCPGLRVAFSAHDVLDSLGSYEISDVLLVVDPRCLPTQASEFAALKDHFSGEQQVAHHLVAFESGVAGTKEQVNLDAAGFVRNIHRFYEPATWPFVAGVAASLVPMSSGVIGDGRLPRSLAELRQELMTRGVSSRDVAVQRGAFDLGCEQGLLAATEQVLVAAPRAAGALLVGEGQLIDSTAKIIGPVAIHADAVIGEHVTIIGPALIGSGARVKSGAVVAHALVGPGCTIKAGDVLRDQVRFDDVPAVTPFDGEGAHLSFSERLTRLTYDLRDRGIEAEEDREPRLQLHAKRVLDAVISGLGLLFLSPLIALLAALVRLESKGPIFYGGEREGVGGRLFKCWKFRTMRTDAHAIQHELKGEDKMDGPHFKLDRDPRVTRLGTVLRATNLDELPQLFNVLVGDMSLVGPRPSPFRENQICVPWREARLSVRPGITGLWQVCRHDRESGDFHQWIEYDLLYVQHISLLLDLKILLATVLTLGGKMAVPSSWLVRTHSAKPDIWIDRHSEQPRDAAVRGPVTRPRQPDERPTSARSA